MELVFSVKERCGDCLLTSRVSVERGKVTSATPALQWAVGEGLHVLLSWAARSQIKWRKRKSRRQAGQMELAL